MPEAVDTVTAAVCGGKAVIQGPRLNLWIQWRRRYHSLGERALDARHACARTSKQRATRRLRRRLPGRSMNVGANKVKLPAGSAAPGRIRLDYFGLSGVTTPEFHPGFAGDTVVQTNDLSGVGNPLAEVTLSQALEDRRGGTISYQVSNGATDGEQNLIWHPIAPGETVNFPQNQPGTALRLRATFSNDNLQPLALIGLSLAWSRTP